MQLDVQAGAPVTLSGLDEAPLLEVSAGAPVTLSGLDEAPLLEVGAAQAISLTVPEPPTLEVGAAQAISLSIASEQGLPGPPGAGGGEPAQRVDYTGTRYWYLGYSSHIIRIDHGVSPPVTGRADSTDWAGREGLGYA